MLGRFITWLRERQERKYDEIISRYSLEEQELIRKGKDVKLTGCSLGGLEKKGLEIEVLNSGEFIVYSRSSIFGLSYEPNVEHWKKIGELGADVIFSCLVFGPDALPHLIGIPARIKNKGQLTWYTQP